MEGFEDFQRMIGPVLMKNLQGKNKLWEKE